MKGELLIQFLLREQRRHSGATGEFTLLLNDIATACKAISHAINRGGLTGTLGAVETANVQGEIQKELDLIANDIFIGALEWTGHLAGMVSEENEEIIQIPASYPKGPYLVCFDPLDGSSNIDLNLSVGSIFSILEAPDSTRKARTTDFLQPGNRQLAAGFCIYGPATILVLTTGNGVNGFTLDRDIGEFILTHPDMKIAPDCSEFAINMSNRRYWESPVCRYIDECVLGTDGIRKRNFNMRWIASLVAEVYRILTRGGIFMYPYDLKEPDRKGRLRLLYEASPMSFIMEQAGGAASNGREKIMTLEPTALHQRVPLILGSRNEVERLMSYHHEEDIKPI